jgi:hypothetical protein
MLIETLKAIRGTTFVTFVAETTPTLRKKGNPLAGRVTKLSRVNGVVGFDYESAVNRQRFREGHPDTFTAAPRKWGQRIAGTPIVSHKDTLYLEVKVEKVLSTTYLVDGREATPEEMAVIQAFLPERAGNPNQEVDREVVLRDYAIESLREITLRGEKIAA